MSNPQGSEFNILRIFTVRTGLAYLIKEDTGVVRRDIVTMTATTYTDVSFRILKGGSEEKN